MMNIIKVRDIFEGAKGTPTGTYITFTSDTALQYVDSYMYVGFVNEEKNDWVVFKVISRAKAPNYDTVYEAVYLGSYYNRHDIFDNYDILNVDLVNVVDAATINKARRNACAT